MDGPVCEELAGAVQRKCFISVFDRDSCEIPHRGKRGERTRMEKSHYAWGGGGGGGSHQHRTSWETIFRFSYPLFRARWKTPVSATTTPCITRFIPFYSLTPGINNDLSRSIDVDVYRERY